MSGGDQIKGFGMVILLLFCLGGIFGETGLAIIVSLAFIGFVIVVIGAIFGFWDKKP
jgi:hypothetical protein